MAKLQMGKAVKQQSMRWPSLTPSELKSFVSILSCSVSSALPRATEATHGLCAALELSGLRT